MKKYFKFADKELSLVVVIEAKSVLAAAKKVAEAHSFWFGSEAREVMRHLVAMGPSRNELLKDHKII